MYTTKPENEAKRLRAFELYMTSAADGKKRSLRSISIELGVVLSTVQYWRDHDQWEARVREALVTTARSTELAAAHVKLAVRDGLLDGLATLKEIIKSDKSPNRDKIAAVREFANIAARIQAIDPQSLAPKSAELEWQDDLPPQPVEPDAAPTEEPKEDAPVQ